MDKLEKKIILNGIDNYSAELERLLPIIRNACIFGLHKGKPEMAEWIALRCHQLAEELDKYVSEDFSLEDMQDYHD